MALAQCRKIIEKLGVRALKTADTAGAVREIFEINDKTQAALGTKLAAEFYDLPILQENVEDVYKRQYIGYIQTSALDDNLFKPSHKIKTIRTYGFKEPSIKSRIISTLSLGAQILPKGEIQNGFYNCGELGFVFAKHVCALDEYFDDPAQIAQMYLGAPYTWGGNSSIGVDCSGLAQNSFRACAINLPRDARMQEELGQNIEIKPDLSGLKRNDLIFWQGHVAIMIDETNIIHANAYHLMTVIEPLEEANQRYLGNNLPIRTIRRHK